MAYYVCNGLPAKICNGHLHCILTSTLTLSSGSPTLDFVVQSVFVIIIAG